MLTHIELVGRELFSRQLLISLVNAYLELFFLNTYTVFVAIFSWAIKTYDNVKKSLIPLNNINELECSSFYQLAKRRTQEYSQCTRVFDHNRAWPQNTFPHKYNILKYNSNWDFLHKPSWSLRSYSVMTSKALYASEAEQIVQSRIYIKNKAIG